MQCNKNKKLYINSLGETNYFLESEVPENYFLAKIFYINDGNNNKRWYEGIEIPEGWVRGKLPISRNWTEDRHKHHTEETKKHISESRKKQGNPWWEGRHHTSETKLKISEKAKNRPRLKLGKLSKEALDLKRVHIIEKYGSLKNFYNKRHETCKKTLKEKYGVENISQTPSWKEKVENTCLEKYNVSFACMRDEARSYTNNSKPNRQFSLLLTENNIPFVREFNIGKFSYDFKINNILIEINPTITHNSSFSPFIQGPINENYHFNKTQTAEKNNYSCIHIWDWDDKEKIINLLKCRETLYARNCVLKEIHNQKEVNIFLNTYHLQNTCKNQKICLGLYFNNKLVSLMTFGKPRYNKNYEYELLRYCSPYRVIGGEEKLFTYFIRTYKPQSIISYCDKSKFSGKIYKKLGFTANENFKPSLHWYNMKTNIHITDNLLRQRGFDQLFKTNYGKGTSNEELMLNHGFVKIYDCGQQTFTWNNL